jgi:hypothetical protein
VLSLFINPKGKSDFDVIRLHTSVLDCTYLDSVGMEAIWGFLHQNSKRKRRERKKQSGPRRQGTIELNEIL